MKLVAGVVGGVLLAMLVLAMSSSASPARAAKIARGKYIAEAVAVCGDCHTPHNEQGEPLAGEDTQRHRALL